MGRPGGAQFPGNVIAVERGRRDGRRKHSGQPRSAELCREVDEITCVWRQVRKLVVAPVVEDREIDVLLHEVDDVDEDEAPLGRVVGEHRLTCPSAGSPGGSHFWELSEQLLETRPNGCPHEVATGRMSAARPPVAEVGVGVDAVQQPDRDDLDRLIEVRENARNADRVSRKGLTVSSHEARVERRHELIRASRGDEVFERASLRAKLVVELDVRLGDVHAIPLTTAPLDAEVPDHEVTVRQRQQLADCAAQHE